MEKKLFLKNGQMVKLGDTISLNIEEGDIKTHIVALVTEATLPMLIKEGVISESDSDCEPCVYNFVESLAKKHNMKPDNLAGFLQKLDSIYPAAAFVTVLREVAVWIDAKYEDHIEKSSEIWVVSLVNGRVFQADKSKIKNYRNFAAFRTKADAQLACKICRKLLRKMFKSGK